MALPRSWIRMSLATVAVAAALGAAAAVVDARSAGGATDPAPRPMPALTPSALALHDAMRKLWEDHITWTRDVIIGFELNDPDPSATLPDLSATLDRLFQNQADMGDAIKPYYGDDLGDQLTALLHDHIAIAGEILQDLKTGDTAAFDDADARWYANAHDIAVFFSQTLQPPLGSLDEMDQMMKDHLDSTTAEVVARLKGIYAGEDGDVAAYETVHQVALDMADMLSAAIVKNFHSRFKH